MNANEYLSYLLKQQALSEKELNTLRLLRDEIQKEISKLPGVSRFYYAGSYAKETIIRQRYDLDIVVYWPSTVNYTLKDIYEAVGDVLKRNWGIAKSKTVSWELPFKGGFHIDVVPGRALDASFIEANLYRTDTKTTLKTSLKKHIEIVKNSGRRDVIRLIKLWRELRRVPFKKSFLLELMTIYGCKGKGKDDLEGQVKAALKYIRDNILSCNIKDPANSNNSLSDDLSKKDRDEIYYAAKAAAEAQSWSFVFPI